MELYRAAISGAHEQAGFAAILLTGALRAIGGGWRGGIVAALAERVRRR